MRLASLSLLVLFMASGASAQTQTTLYPGLSGQTLLDAIRADYAPTGTLGYNRARDSLYSYDQYTFGQVCGVYTQYCISLTPGADPSTDAYNKGINAEHTWPQSMGAGSEPQKSDLHHLFPAKDNVNSSRGNNPYGEIPDGEADGWYRQSASQSTTPSVFVDEWSEKDNDHPNPAFTGRFEPREDHAGNAARAMFYFAAIYPSAVTAAGAEAFFDVQKNDLIGWHYQDQVDMNEDDRSLWIAVHQGNENPFVLDSTLARRAFNLSGTPGGSTPPGGGADVWVNEIHYDNAGGDVNEGVEVAGPAGTDLSGWTLAFYNGSGGAVYSTVSLSGTISDQQGGYGTVWFAESGIQNGSPDGVALIDASGDVVQFLSYEGVLTATSGAASGSVSVDIGVTETSSTAIGSSLQLGGTGATSGDFAWEGSQTATPGSPNVNQTLSGGPAPVAAWINEFHYDNVSSDVNEGIEVAGTAGLDLTGWSIALYNGSGGATYGTLSLSGTIDDEGTGFGAQWFSRSGLQNGSPDGFALVDDTGTVVQFLSYEGTVTATDGPASGMVSEDVGVSETGSTPTSSSLQLSGTGSTYADFAWTGPQAHSRGSKNSGQVFSAAALVVSTDAPASDGAPEAAPDVSVFPSPLRSGRTLRVQVIASEARAVLYDALGREVMTASGVAPALRFETGGLSAGVYVVRVEASGAVTTHTVTVVR